MKSRHFVTTTLTCCFVLQLAVSAAAEDWPRFRGRNGNGLADDLAVPNTWAESDYSWQQKLPGLGHSSPVIFDGKVLITSGNPENGNVMLLCFQAADGKKLWDKEFEGQTYQMHTLNTYATTSPAVDDKHIYFTWATPGNIKIAAITHDGKTEVWRRELGAFHGPHGFSASPMVIDDIVCMQCDVEGRGFVIGMDCMTGKDRWTVDRPNGKAAYSTPAIMKMPGGKEVLVASSQQAGLEAIDPATGDIVWQRDNVLSVRTVGSPLVVDDIVIATCGVGGNGKTLVASKVTGPDKVEEMYTLTKNVPFVPTPVAKNGLLFLWHERGTVSCVDLETGKPHWTKRVGGKFYSSPVCIGDRIFATSTEGEMVVLAASDKYELLAKTDLGEPSQATVAVADGRMFIRTESKLMCLEQIRLPTESE